MLDGITIKELREALAKFEGTPEDDMLAVTGISYGDRAGTVQAIPLNDIAKVSITETAYSDSGYKIKDEDAETSDDVKAISLNVCGY